jgi:uncharacterized membrane protein YphA (DoxX/SURF4 family)
MKKLLITLLASLTLVTSALAELGSVGKDLVFTPLTPCRIFDTRTTSGGSGPIATNGIKSFKIWGAANYTSQGGAPNNCEVGAGNEIVAVALSMAVAYPAGQGYLTAYPFGVPKPAASSLNYNTGEVVVSNSTIVKVAQTGTSHLSVFASNTTEVIADIVGYFTRPIATPLSCVTSATFFMTVAPNSTANSTAPACSEGLTSTALYCNTTSPDVITYAFAGSTCAAKNFSSTTAGGLIASQRCCKIGGI